MPAPPPVTLLSWPRSPVAVKDALSEDCPVMQRLDVEQVVASNKVGVMAERMRNEMVKIQMGKKCGLVHWSGVEEGRSCDWQNLIQGSGETMFGGVHGRSGGVDEVDDTVDDDASGSTTASGT